MYDADSKILLLFPTFSSESLNTAVLEYYKIEKVITLINNVHYKNTK